MASFNKVIMLGNLTRDPEMKFLPSGTPVAEFGMAMNRKWMDQATNQPREAVTFVDCKAMGRQAEILSQHMRKGSPLFVEGRLDYRQWEGPDGSKRSKLEVFVETFSSSGRPGTSRAAIRRACEVVPLGPVRRSGARRGWMSPSASPREPGKTCPSEVSVSGSFGIGVTPVQQVLARAPAGGKGREIPIAGSRNPPLNTFAGSNPRPAHLSRDRCVRCAHR